MECTESAVYLCGVKVMGAKEKELNTLRGNGVFEEVFMVN